MLTDLNKKSLEHTYPPEMNGHFLMCNYRNYRPFYPTDLNVQEKFHVQNLGFVPIRIKLASASSIEN